ncbi:MAG: hypothetical protein LBS72_05105 [Oscillospiraceae bacterium]|jgi:23S rRNA (cytidine2498-2'-O)-methyltransferase|nr:hypothetical protein [Oscillospiraceae bacterium]
MNEVLFTCQPDAEKLALSEMREHARHAAAFRWITAGVGLLAAEREFSYWSSAPMVYVRHVCPVDAHIPMAEGAAEQARRYILQTLGSPPYSTHTAESFAVQARTLGPLGGGTKGAALDAIDQALADVGVKRASGAPDWAISCAFTRDEIMLGISHVSQNKSPWAGGCRPFARSGELICRSEFKLLEAIEAFDICAPHGGRALDLGASPGGWTRVLRNSGMRVTAVDPAELDPRVAVDPLVEHIRTTGQRYLSDSSGAPFDIIVNDMKMDAELSADIMAQAAARLKPGADAVLTLKLPARDWQSRINAARNILAKSYVIRDIRQLFHNRCEVTCALTTHGAALPPDA